MCGIYVSLGFEPDRSRIELVEHRGPDGGGWTEFPSNAGPVALGHRRLAIIDLSHSAEQPMSDDSGRYHIVFNGEIYNYKELRDELIASGYKFNTASDSEVLLKAYMEWKQSALDRLLGMFAFAVWDQKEQSLFVARDRFGIKPLYFVQNNHRFAFASEIKQLLNLDGVSSQMNVPRMRDFLASGISNHTDETMYRNIRQIRAGECALISSREQAQFNIQIRRWYQIPKMQELNLSREDATEQFRDLLRDSVRLHLRSDVRVGSCLSGGLDSSSLVCLMDEALEGSGRKVSTVSACFQEKAVDEKPFMESVINHTGSQPRYVFPKPDDVMAQAKKITWHQDEPFGSTSIFAQWCVFEEAKRSGLTVMLDGQGADEPLAGYHSGFFYYFSELAQRGKWLEMLCAMLARRRVHGTPFMAQLSGIPLPLQLSKLLQKSHLSMSAPPNRSWLDSDAFHDLPPLGSTFDDAVKYAGLEPVNDIQSFCRAMTFATSLQILLHYEDRNSMAHSIEARVPFLDHRLVELVLALDSNQKIGGAETKRVMRWAMQGILPEMVRNRQDKLGFATPEEVWFLGPLKESIAQAVEETIQRFPDLFNVDEVRLLVADYFDGRRPFDFGLWRIANVGIWGQVMGVSL